VLRGRVAQCVTAARKFAIPKRVRGTCRAGLTRVRALSPALSSPPLPFPGRLVVGPSALLAAR